ncbi:FAD-dependent oxidoreductase [Blastopirellula sp. JC732]|uniref:FAD-dependent oxidoreductase n=1 Tax=Blastopirellula sediminis TaxID=2894196 RepID=A0A9X1MTU8_9BACT|nr:FAD-dependent oxidoreductase [Blastopirellula sediminis]MCC9604729.1 FAD-dependent oxidoreductase [Blastopirellula sediminis]MCC9631972.1 FAD-dependent oxidoreductase [Blastopirellula sediminis]
MAILARSCSAILITLLGLWCIPSAATAAEKTLEADLLIVGGTESGCAAAVQAARMGIERIVLVNDIEWLGGQFSAEALGAIDENRAHDYNGEVPIPRSGLFREVIDAIERKNKELYGSARPGNTRVITTCQPKLANQIFGELLQPYEATGQIRRISNLRPKSVGVEENRVVNVLFEPTTGGSESLQVNAKLTIDASDWGDVIKLSGAAYDFGLDARAEYGEPRAQESPDPKTDVNPITWCMILVEQENEATIPEPAGYDERNFHGMWSWIDDKFNYTTRRLVDGKALTDRQQPDIILINNPPIDYPLDTLPANVAAALEKTEAGAATKPIVDLTPAQREIIFQDARLRTLQYLYYLQQKYPLFRKLALSDEFGTPDKLPPKPYVRESLRLEALHMIKEQEVLGEGSQSNYAQTMFEDGVFSWQFELDFHPTARRWMTPDGPEGPWEATFRGKRRFGVGGTGRAIFPMRSFVPVEFDGLLGAQKNLGYTSIVSSSCRLHDQSTAAGQACGAIAAVSLQQEVEPRQIWFDQQLLAKVWNGLLPEKDAAPVAIWPFGDVDPYDTGFVAIQQLAARRLLPLGPADVDFQPEAAADEKWMNDVVAKIRAKGYECAAPANSAKLTRRDAAIALWKEIASQPTPVTQRKSANDADGDGIPDARDALPFTPGENSWR